MKKRYLTFSIIIFISLQLGCSEQKASSLATLIANTKPTNIKILLIGIDGATFSVINPMLKQSQLPQFKRLIDNGAHGILKSQKPMFSPIIWTSIVTGKTPQEHGIEKFVFNEKLQDLYCSNNRKVQALWNIVGPFGKTAGFAAWWATWPAETVNGWIISDWITLNRYGHWSTKQELVTEHLTYPPSLANELRPFNVNPAHPPLDEIKQLAEFSAEEMNELEAANKPIFGHGLSVLKFAYCTQRTNEEMALYMLNKRQPDLTGIFLIANDQLSHTFWHYYEPDKFTGVDHKKADRLGHVIPNIYIHNDKYLTRLLETVDKNTVVIIVSDHGFQATGVLPKTMSASEFSKWFKNQQALRNRGNKVAIGQSGDHHIDGVFIASGGPIKKGVELTAQIVDIAPTILTLMGLPVPEDMKGRVLKEIIDPEFLRKNPIKTIKSYEDYINRKKVDVSTKAVNREKIDMLRALGYVQ